MTPNQLRDARATLGEMWGLRRPLYMSELGRVLRLAGEDPGQTIRKYEQGRHPISGPISVAVDMMLNGSLPPDGFTAAVVRKDLS